MPVLKNLRRSELPRLRIGVRAFQEALKTLVDEGNAERILSRWGPFCRAILGFVEDFGREIENTGRVARFHLVFSCLYLGTTIRGLAGFLFIR